MKKLLLVVPMLLLLTGASCPVSAPTTLPPNAVNITDPIKAEDAFFILLKRTREHARTLPANTMTAEIEAFQDATRATYDGIESWREGHGDADYRIAWARMLAAAVPIEIAAKRK